MVFDNVFGFVKHSAERFSAETQPKAKDFEDTEEDAYDDKSMSLFNNAIHGTSSRARVVREQSPEARAILRFLGEFIQIAQESAGKQAQDTQDADSVSKAATDSMQKGSETVRNEDGLEKNKDLRDMPDKKDYAKAPEPPAPPQAAEPPKAPKATAETPPTLGESKATTEKPSGSQ
ncbi:hypothetical protein ACF06Q_08135 [Streptomyces leeuwenhoekii]|uniref:hypothetical protein n=1 Tax=Streptomyces leeuwenhoekii TaxID=1437453 RepID=UPI0036F53D04